MARIFTKPKLSPTVGGEMHLLNVHDLVLLLGMVPGVILSSGHSDIRSQWAEEDNYLLTRHPSEKTAHLISMNNRVLCFVYVSTYWAIDMAVGQHKNRL